MSARARPAPSRAPHATAAAARRPTVTDANLVLGRLDPDAFHGGKTRLDVAAARAAVERLAETLAMSIEEDGAGHRQGGQRQYGERHRHRYGAARHRRARICLAVVRRRGRRACDRLATRLEMERGHHPAVPRRVLRGRPAGGRRAARFRQRARRRVEQRSRSRRARADVPAHGAGGARGARSRWFRHGLGSAGAQRRPQGPGPDLRAHGAASASGPGDADAGSALLVDAFGSLYRERYAFFFEGEPIELVNSAARGLRRNAPVVLAGSAPASSRSVAGAHPPRGRSISTRQAISTAPCSGAIACARA